MAYPTIAMSVAAEASNARRVVMQLYDGSTKQTGYRVWNVWLSNSSVGIPTTGTPIIGVYIGVATKTYRTNRHIEIAANTSVGVNVVYTAAGNVFFHAMCEGVWTKEVIAFA